jgi:hypothetical protein
MGNTDPAHKIPAYLGKLPAVLIQFIAFLRTSGLLHIYYYLIQLMKP